MILASILSRRGRLRRDYLNRLMKVLVYILINTNLAIYFYTFRNYNIISTKKIDINQGKFIIKLFTFTKFLMFPFIVSNSAFYSTLGYSIVFFKYRRCKQFVISSNKNLEVFK